MPSQFLPHARTTIHASLASRPQPAATDAGDDAESPETSLRPVNAQIYWSADRPVCTLPLLVAQWDAGRALLVNVLLPAKVISLRRAGGQGLTYEAPLQQLTIPKESSIRVAIVIQQWLRRLAA